MVTHMLIIVTGDGAYQIARLSAVYCILYIGYISINLLRRVQPLLKMLILQYKINIGLPEKFRYS